MTHKIWRSSAHVAGVKNVEADHRSRYFKQNYEWMLNPCIYLFATRLNTQIEKFVSWEPDPEAWAIDAFALDWSKLQFYAFHPFSLLTRCLQKVKLEQATGIIIAPDWPTQPWFSVLKAMCVRTPVVIRWNRR
jgi:hypothetical protein